jgi:hypothetical protein
MLLSFHPSYENTLQTMFQQFKTLVRMINYPKWTIVDNYVLTIHLYLCTYPYWVVTWFGDLKPLVWFQLVKIEPKPSLIFGIIIEIYILKN